MTDTKRLWAYFFSDVVSATLAWLLFNVLRFYSFRSTIDFDSLQGFLFNNKSLFISVVIPFLWCGLYFLTGYYTQPRRKTTASDLTNTLITTFIGVLFLFFAIIVNDYPESSALYYEIIFGFFIIHSVFTFIFRSLHTVLLLRNQQKGKDRVSVLIIGSGEKAGALYKEFSQNKSGYSYKLAGCVRFKKLDPALPSSLLLGDMQALPHLIETWRVEELILAIDEQDNETRSQLLNTLYPYRIPIKSAASQNDIVSGYVSLVSLLGIPMVSLTPGLMPAWQQNIKWLADKVIAVVSLIVMIPLFVLLAIRVKRDSPGPIFYQQERIGRSGTPFTIYKFRTMYNDAEANGPSLSSSDDPRVTPVGKIMRKYRLDELPQFFNILKGDMALVGPRPERLYYVNQIVERAPHYYLTQLVLPGITSWGMVKYGYANTIEQMIKRLEYDILYLENQSLLIDFKILIFTIKPLFKGKGV